MPELPELQIIINQLKDEIQYSYISAADVRDSALPEDIGFAEGQKIIDIVRYDKNIYFQLSRDAFTIFLGRYGKLMLSHSRPRIKGTRLVLLTDRGNLYLVDKSRGSAVQFIDKDVTYLPSVGVDPLTKQFNFKMLYHALQSVDGRIDDFLLRKNVIAGIGRNYMRTILHRSHIKPTTITRRIGKRTAVRLFWNIKNILREAILEKSPQADLSDIFDDGLFAGEITVPKA